MTPHTHIANDPKYVVGVDQKSIVLCDGDRHISTILTNLTPANAAAFALHLGLAVSLGERKAELELGKELTP